MADLATRSKDIFELNYLAEKMQSFHKGDAQQFMDVLTALGGGMLNAIDLATHYGNLAFYTDIFDHMDLGVEFMKQNTGCDPELFADSFLIDCGRYVARTMRGIFLDSGVFVGFPREFFKNRYDGHVLPVTNICDPHITMEVGRRTYGVAPYRNELVSFPQPVAFRKVKLPAVDFGSPSVKVKIPLNASATYISRLLERLAVSIDQPPKATKASYVFKPDDMSIRAGIYSDKIGDVSEIAHHYIAMTPEQRTVFCGLVEDLFVKSNRDAINGRGQYTNTCGIVYKHDLLEKMKHEYGYIPPLCESPTTLVLQRSKTRTPLTYSKGCREMTTIVLPASQKEIDAAESSLAMPEEKLIVRSFSLNMNSGMIQKMLDQNKTLSEINNYFLYGGQNNE
jgi:hypothetical protein